MIVSGGENVFPLRSRTSSADIPTSSEATAIGVDDKDFGQRLRASWCSRTV